MKRLNFHGRSNPEKFRVKLLVDVISVVYFHNNSSLAQVVVAKFIGQNDYKVSQEYMRFDEGSEESVVIIRDLIIPPQAEVIITFGVKKSMM